jgi:hypothetical protein
VTKKNFELIAECLRDSRAPAHVVETFANTLATTNGRFDKRRFIEASTATDPFDADEKRPAGVADGSRV